MSQVPRETLFAALRSLVPELVGSRLEVVGLPPVAPLGGGPGSLAVVLIVGTAEPVDEKDLADSLGSIRASLALDGRLLWAGLPEESRVLRAALPEAGFLIQRRVLGGPAGFEILVARPDAFVVRSYREGDEARILPLFEISFSARRTPERWAWEYRDNPYGAHRISQAFDSEGRLVAHYAGYPVWFQRVGQSGHERLSALQIGDTMTAREVRHIGRGPTSLLGRTVGHYYARFCEGQVAFNYGFNTANIQKFSLRFVGAKKVEPVAFRVRDAKRPWPRRSLRERLTGGFRVERVRDFDRRFDAFFTRVRDAYGLLVERNARYLSWRYGACPDDEYLTYAVYRRERLVGWGVFRLRNEALVWGDALFDPRYPLAVARLLERAAGDHPVQQFEGWLPPRPEWWARTLAEVGFEPRPDPQDLALMVVPFGWDPEEDFRNRLYYSKGDGDLF